MSNSLQTAKIGFRKLLSANEFALSFSMLAGGTAIGQIITIISAPVLTRIYQPEDLGVTAAYTAIVFIFVSIGSGRYELALPKAEDSDSAINLFGLSFLILITFVTVLSTFLFFFGKQMSEMLNISLLAPYVWLLPLSLFGGGSYQILNYWALRVNSIQELSQTKLAQSLSQSGIQITLGFFGIGLFGLLLGDVVGRTSGSGKLAINVWKNNSVDFRAVSFAGMWKIAAKYKRFPLYSSWAALFNRIGNQAPTLLIASLYGAQIAGFFGLGQRVISLPIGVIGLAAGQLYFARASKMANLDFQKLRNLYHSMVRRLFLIGIIPIAILSIAGPYVFQVIFGDAWQIAGFYAQLLGLKFLLQFVVMPVSQTLTAIDRQDLQLGWDSLRVFVTIFSIIIPWHMQWSVTGVILSYSISASLLYLLYLILCHYQLSNEVGR